MPARQAIELEAVQPGEVDRPWVWKIDQDDVPEPAVGIAQVGVRVPVFDPHTWVGKRVVVQLDQHLVRAPQRGHGRIDVDQGDVHGLGVSQHLAQRQSIATAEDQDVTPGRTRQHGWVHERLVIPLLVVGAELCVTIEIQPVVVPKPGHHDALVASLVLVDHLVAILALLAEQHDRLGQPGQGNQKQRHPGERHAQGATPREHLAMTREQQAGHHQVDGAQRNRGIGEPEKRQRHESEQHPSQQSPIVVVFQHRADVHTELVEHLVEPGGERNLDADQQADGERDAVDDRRQARCPGGQEVGQGGTGGADHRQEELHGDERVEERPSNEPTEPAPHTHREEHQGHGEGPLQHRVPEQVAGQGGHHILGHDASQTGCENTGFEHQALGRSLAGGGGCRHAFAEVSQAHCRSRPSTTLNVDTEQYRRTERRCDAGGSPRTATE